MAEQAQDPIVISPELLQQQRQLQQHIDDAVAEETAWQRAEQAAEHMVGNSVEDVVRRAEVADAIKDTGAIIAIFTD